MAASRPTRPRRLSGWRLPARGAALILVFLVTLALLARAILAELERPRETTVAAAGSCPGCSRPVEADWVLCPRCRTLLREGCPGCGRQLGVCHRFCPWCGRRRGEAQP
jgi:hypothetical protein